MGNRGRHGRRLDQEISALHPRAALRDRRCAHRPWRGDRARHAMAASEIGNDLGPPFGRGRGGPGGWWLLDEPELHLQQDVVVPDLAGWRRERLPTIPDEAAFTLRPDWVCEVLSASTERTDRALKLPIYAREEVPFVWLVNPSSE